MTLTALSLILSCLAAGFVQSTAGLGYTIVSMALLPLFLPYLTANLASLVSAVLVLVTNAWSLRKSIDYRLMALPVLTSLIGRTISLQLFAVAAERFLLTFSGCFLICVAVYLAFFSDRFFLKPTRKNGAIVGFFAGLFGGLTNISGPIFVIYYLPASRSNDEYSATLQFSFLFGCLYTLAIQTMRGHVTKEVVWFGLLGGVVALLGAYAGRVVFKLLNRTLLRKILCVLIAIMGFIQLVKSF